MKVLLLSVLRPGSTVVVGFQMEVGCLSVNICCHWPSCLGLSIQVSEVEEQLKYVLDRCLLNLMCLNRVAFDVKAAGRDRKGSKELKTGCPDTF